MTHTLFSESVTSKLEFLAQSNAMHYFQGDPFPHIVIDNFLPEQIVRDALAVYPNSKQLRWIDYDRKYERKLAFPEAEKLASPIRDLLYFLNSAVVLRFLENLTGIRGLIPDPYFLGGGLHQIEPGGYLGVHADFNRYEHLKLDRRLNLLLYLNLDWNEEYGGHLELWDRSMTSCVKKILPIFNRCVVFSTTSDAYHGHPKPLNCPQHRTRKSIATYYYTNGRPNEEIRSGHSTLFQNHPVVDADSLYNRVRRTSRQIIKAFLPPVFSDTFYWLRNRFRRNP